ncbi:hypothetical protein JM83_3893 [Gillisia sp. Hel_I_86]|uniref:hypothetical protein n=1 Tax=Gillisia sp. Hel_I_86 TaxID=1249981 RepID=UPI00119A8D30|nr:hypothetical protein [Gillisia sp. Hel_I_86]TVZ28743.1 hypothetical protein JM83_3893 [Gillisia sp. Hel_I_86]
MKQIKLIATIVVLTVLAACEKSEDPSENVIEGTYLGTLTHSDGLKRNGASQEEDAVAEVTNIGNNLLEIHCYSNELDTTFVLNYYQHDDSVLVCFNGEDFENMYGHMLGQGHGSGSMMNDKQNGETEWTHHLNDEHEEGDEHFGGFSMQDQAFGYRFKMMDGDVPYYLQFQGKRQEL